MWPFRNLPVCKVIDLWTGSQSLGLICVPSHSAVSILCFNKTRIWRAPSLGMTCLVDRTVCFHFRVAYSTWHWASHLGDTLYLFKSAFLPGVVMVNSCRTVTPCFLVTKHLHLHVLIQSSHQPWEEGEAKRVVYPHNTRSPENEGTCSELLRPSGMQLFLEFHFHWSRASQSCQWISKSS